MYHTSINAYSTLAWNTCVLTHPSGYASDPSFTANGTRQQADERHVYMMPTKQPSSVILRKTV